MNGQTLDSFQQSDSVFNSQSRRVFKRVQPRTESSLTKLPQPVVGDVGIQIKRPPLLRPRPPTRPAQRMYVSDRQSIGFRWRISHSKHTELTEQSDCQPATRSTELTEQSECQPATRSTELTEQSDCQPSTRSTELTEQSDCQPSTRSTELTEQRVCQPDTRSI